MRIFAGLSCFGLLCALFYLILKLDKQTQSLARASDALREKKAWERRLKHNQLLLEMLTRNFQSKQEQLDYALHELLKLSGSKYGYIYFYDEEKEKFTLNTWTQGVMKECTVPGKPKIYQLEKTGIWGEVVRQRKPIIVNEFTAPHPLKKGYPEGHVLLKKYMSIPVIIDDKIVAAVGFANKEEDYDENDVREMITLMAGVWNAVQRREATREIEDMSFRDSLTGLYNRRFFSEELQRLDTERNLPLSILIGDVNSLKLVNDICGHAAGDMLLKRVAAIMRRVCRADDIIARWGGDEFALLLPGTNSEDAAKIVQRIKEETSGEEFCAVGASIAIAHGTKTDISEDIIQILDMAETKMYAAKTLERDTLQNRELGDIVGILTRNSEYEGQHAEYVGTLCRKLGLALGLPESDVRKLTAAGRLHDIGKIALDQELLKSGSPRDPVEEKAWEQHPLVGYRILNYFDETLELAEAVLAHHEHWDGSGYPRGLTGKSIPLFARIIALANAYAHMLNGGPKQAGGKSHAAALREIKAQAGAKFDPEIVKVFLEL